MGRRNKKQKISKFAIYKKIFAIILILFLIINMLGIALNWIGPILFWINLCFLGAISYWFYGKNIK